LERNVPFSDSEKENIDILDYLRAIWGAESVKMLIIARNSLLESYLKRLFTIMSIFLTTFLFNQRFFEKVVGDSTIMAERVGAPP
jgi:hypothetical protein